MVQTRMLYDDHRKNEPNQLERAKNSQEKEKVLLQRQDEGKYLEDARRIKQDLSELSMFFKSTCKIN